MMSLKGELFKRVRGALSDEDREESSKRLSLEEVRITWQSLVYEMQMVRRQQQQCFDYGY